METFLVYDFKVALLLSAFLGLYLLLMRKETWFALRRTYLLLSALLSLALPFCILTFHREETVVMPLVPGDITHATSEMNENGWIPLEVLCTIAGTAIITGAVIVCARLITNLFRLRKLIKETVKRRLTNGTVLAISDQDIRPFSFFHYLVISSADCKELSPELLAHEQEHIHRHHTLDLLFTELFLALQWFNPMAWQMRKELKLVHEFEADFNVVHQGGTYAQYMRLLMRKASGCQQFQFVNTFSHKGFLRRRFMMMSSLPSSRKSQLKVLSMLPVIAVSLVATAQTITDYTFVHEQHEQHEQHVQEQTTARKIKNNQRKEKKQIGNHAHPSSKEESKNSMYVYVDSMPVSQELLSTLEPGQIRSITIVKDSAETNTSSLSPQEQATVYVEMKDTVLKKVDDDVFMMTDKQHEQVRVMKETQETRKKALEERIKAEKIKKEAIKKAVEERIKAQKIKKEAIKKAAEEKFKAEFISPDVKENAFILTDRKDTTLCLKVDSDSIVNGFNAYWIDTRGGKSLIVIQADTDSVKNNRIAMVFMQS